VEHLGQIGTGRGKWRRVKQWALVCRKQASALKGHLPAIANPVTSVKAPATLADPKMLSMPEKARTALTLPEAADTLGIGLELLRELLESGKLASIYIGHRRVVPVVAIHRYVERALEDAGFGR
jgi:excisionase family DNA binding protein